MAAGIQAQERLSGRDCGLAVRDTGITELAHPAGYSYFRCGRQEAASIRPGKDASKCG